MRRWSPSAGSVRAATTTARSSSTAVPAGSWPCRRTARARPRRGSGRRRGWWGSRRASGGREAATSVLGLPRSDGLALEFRFAGARGGDRPAGEHLGEEPPGVAGLHADDLLGRAGRDDRDTARAALATQIDHTKIGRASSWKREG